MRHVLLAMILLMLAIEGLEVSPSAHFLQSRAEATEPSAKNEFKAAWMGKPMSEVEAKFGRPTKMEKLKDTGGTRYSYRVPGQPHYVFEFSASGKVTAAALLD